MKNSLRKYVLNFLLIIGLTVFALWFALKDDLDTVLELIQGLKYYQFIIIIAWGVLYYIIIGWILAVIARKYNKDYTITNGFINGMVGGFFSGITPSATGGQFGQAYIFKRQGIKYSEGASILWVDFIIFQSVMMLYVAVLMLFRFTYFYNMSSPFFILVFIGFIINGAVIAVLWGMVKFPKISMKVCNFGINILAKIKIVKNPNELKENLNIQIISFKNEINNIKDDKKLICKTILLNILRVTVNFALPYYLLYILGVELDFMMFINVIAMSSFVYMVNAFFPVPGATGGTESVFILIFTNLFDRSICASVMILWRIATYHLIILLGGFIFLIYKNILDSKKDNIIINNELEDKNENRAIY